MITPWRLITNYTLYWQQNRSRDVEIEGKILEGLGEIYD